MTPNSGWKQLVNTLGLGHIRSVAVSGASSHIRQTPSGLPPPQDALTQGFFADLKRTTNESLGFLIAALDGLNHGNRSHRSNRLIRLLG